jgi:PAS domain S-box-containing protein
MSVSRVDVLTVAVCQIYLSEVVTVIDLEHWDDVRVVAFPSRCGRPPLGKPELQELVGDDVGEILVIGGACVCGLEKSERPTCKQSLNCFALFHSRLLVEEFMAQGAYLVTPGWLEVWREKIEEFGFGQKELRDFFSDSMKKIVLLDTLLKPESGGQLEELCEHVGLEGEKVGVGLDYFQMYLTNCVLDWRQQLMEERLVKVRAQSSNASLTLNLLSTMGPTVTYIQACDQIREMLEMFMAPESVVIEVVDSSVQSILLQGDSETVHLSVLDNQDSAYHLYEGGFHLLLQVNESYNCVISVHKLYIDDNVEEYVNLALLLCGHIRLILINGLLYERIIGEVESKELAEKRLEKSEKHFRFLYEHAPLPYHSLDGDGNIVDVNKAWLEVLGFEQQEVLGKPFQEFLHKDSENSYITGFDTLKKRGGTRAAELKLVKKDGTNILIQLDGTVSVDDGGEFIRTHCIFLDVSGQKQIKELILQSEKLSTIAGLAAGIAHEINTPLSGILQSAQLIEMFLNPKNENNNKLAGEHGVDLVALQSYFKEQELDYFLRGIRESALKASGIIRSLLEFSRPVKSKPEMVRLPHLLDSAMRLTLSDYDLKKKYDVINTKFETTYDPAVPVIHCVAMEIEQVIMNLIKNGVHAMGQAAVKTPCIKIRTRLAGENVQIEVEDNGPGIPAEVKKYAFDPFYTTKAPGEGTGLGLSISFAIITENHKGLIWIDSDFTEGTRFVIELPVGIEATPMN